MIRRTLFGVLAAALVASGSGCVLDGAYISGPSAFDPVGPAPGPLVAAAPTAASPDDCATCAAKPSTYRGPWLFSWWPELSFPCGFGCGDFYWSEWFNDPPQDCDSCDLQGNWTGPRCCKPRFRTHPFYYLAHIPLFGVQERPAGTWGFPGYAPGGYGVAAPMEAPFGGVPLEPSPAPVPSPPPDSIPSPSAAPVPSPPPDSPKSAAATAPNRLR